jgi:hypothetical protein
VQTERTRFADCRACHAESLAVVATKKTRSRSRQYSIVPFRLNNCPRARRTKFSAAAIFRANDGDIRSNAGRSLRRIRDLHSNLPVTAAAFGSRYRLADALKSPSRAVARAIRCRTNESSDDAKHSDL